MFSTAQNTQRDSQNYVEKRRGMEEIEVIWGRKGRQETEVTRRIKGGIKRRDTDPASNQFPKCSPQSKIHKEIHRVG